jgi:hypothetical protein
MAARKTVDRRPGPLPDIQLEGDSVVFSFDLTESLDSHLVMRCDARGDVYVSILKVTALPPYPFTAGE